MKGFLKFVVIFASILLLSAILAPILFDFLPYKFERIFNRLVMIGSLLAIVKFVRLKVNLSQYGLNPTSARYRAFGIAFLSSVFILTIVMVLEVFFGNVRWALQSLTFLDWAGKIAMALLSAMVIGIIEEFFFRGYIYQTIKDKFKWGIVAAFILTSIFYSSLHFVSEYKPLIGPDPTFRDSLTLMAAPFHSLFRIGQIWPEAVGLLIFGMVLNFLVIRTGNLYASIGMHAGSVFFVKLDGLFADFLNKSPAFFWGTKNIYDGVLGWFFIILLGFVIVFLIKKFPLQGQNV